MIILGIVLLARRISAQNLNPVDHRAQPGRRRASCDPLWHRTRYRRLRQLFLKPEITPRAPSLLQHHKCRFCDRPSRLFDMGAVRSSHEMPFWHGF